MKSSIQNSQEKRGFTTGEKWVIWAVFCALVGLSTYRFTVFVGLISITLGVSLLVKRTHFFLGVVLCLMGLASVIFSKYLF